MADSFGDRVAAIRRKLGTERARVSQGGLADILTERTGVALDNNKVSRIEAGTFRKFYEALAILRALHDLDPDKQGYDWLIGTEPLPLKQEKRKHKARPSGRKPTRLGKGYSDKDTNRRDKTG